MLIFALIDLEIDVVVVALTSVLTDGNLELVAWMVVLILLSRLGSRG